MKTLMAMEREGLWEYRGTPSQSLFLSRTVPARHLGQDHEEDDGEAAAVEHHPHVQRLHLRPVLVRRHGDERQVRRPRLAGKRSGQIKAAGGMQARAETLRGWIALRHRFCSAEYAREDCTEVLVTHHRSAHTTLQASPFGAVVWRCALYTCSGTVEGWINASLVLWARCGAARWRSAELCGSGLR